METNASINNPDRSDVEATERGRNQFQLLRDETNKKESEELLLRMIEDGGKDFLLQRDTSNGRGLTILQVAMLQNASFNLIEKMVEMGGRELVMAKNVDEETALHLAFDENLFTSFEVIDKLVQVGGKELVMARAKPTSVNATALHLACVWKASTQVVARLAKVGGKELVMAKHLNGMTALTFACIDDSPLEMIDTLIDIGGRELVMSTDVAGQSALHFASSNDVSIELLNRLIEVGGKELVLSSTSQPNGMNTLQTALNMNVKTRIETIDSLIKVGGKELVMTKYSEEFNMSILHLAFLVHASDDVVKRLIEVGGRDILMATEFNGNTALHSACEDDASVDVVERMIELGGKELIMVKNSRGETALHTASHHASVDVVESLIKFGEKDLFMEEDFDEKTALHVAVQYASSDVVKKLIELGGKNLIMKKDSDGKNALHTACEQEDISYRLILRLVEVGGKEALEDNETDDGETPLGIVLEHMKFHDCIFQYLIVKGLEFKVGGEFGIGGLFNTWACHDYVKWADKFAPFLEWIIQMREFNPLPILHAAIKSELPFEIIQDIINRFEFSLTVVDSLGRNPIQVINDAYHDDYPKQKLIITAFTKGKRRLPINLAALYGVKWSWGVKGLMEESLVNDENWQDGETGLYPFMLAAMGGESVESDLDTIYELARRMPELVKMFNDKHVNHISTKVRKIRTNDDKHVAHICKKMRKNN